MKVVVNYQIEMDKLIFYRYATNCVWWNLLWIFSIGIEQKFYLAFSPQIIFHTLMIPILFWISKRVSLITCFLFILNWVVAKTANTGNRCVTHRQDKSLLA